MIRTWRSFNDLYEGRTVFIVGAGGSLADVPKEQLLLVGERPSIGLNAVPYVCPTRIFLSAYMAMCLLAQRAYLRRGESGATVVNMKLGRVRHAHHDGVVRVQRQRYKRGLGLPRRFGSMGPVLYTSQNGALAATHLAYIMGARRVVYLGVDMRDQVHFYHVWLHVNMKIWCDVIQLRRMCRSHQKTLARLHKQFDPHLAQHRRVFGFQSPFLPREGVDRVRQVFEDYFTILDCGGVEVHTATRDSIVRDAGACYTPLTEALEWDE